MTMMIDEETLLETIASTQPSEERSAQIECLIDALDKKPELLRRTLKNYHWLELRNAFSDKLCYPEDSEEYLSNSEWSRWNDHGWEHLWKRFLVELMALYDKWPKKTQEHFRIIDTKEKWGLIRIDLSCYDDEVHKLIAAAEMLSKVTCPICGKMPLNSRGEHLMYKTEGWIGYYCRDCFNGRYLHGKRHTKENRRALKELRRDAKTEIKNFYIGIYDIDKHTSYRLVEKYGWLYREDVQTRRH